MNAALAAETGADDRHRPGLVMVVGEGTGGSPHVLTAGVLTARLRGLAALQPGELGDPAAVPVVTRRVVPAAEHVAVMYVDADARRETAAASDPVAARLAAVQWDLDEGPAVEDGPGADTVVVDDLAGAGRWPRLARAAVEHGACSLLAVRSEVDGVGRVTLVAYGRRTGAFDATDRELARVVAGYGAVAVAAAWHRRRADNLAQALETSRQIGMAVGIVMARELVPPDQAFERLRLASQRRHRKLREIADDVVRTGELAIGEPGRRSADQV